MRILLVYPPVLHERVHREEVSVPPMGLFYVGALLREHGIEVEILNGHDLGVGDRPNALDAAFERFRPHVVGFSVLHANRWGAVDMARRVKRLGPGVPVVFGGIGATFLWRQILATVPEVDHVVLGEGERAFLGLVLHLDRDPAAVPEHVAGLAFRSKGVPVRTGTPDRIRDLDALPHPGRYFTYQHVAATRGCTRACAFCGSPRFWGREVRAHSPAWFVEELDLLHRRGGAFFYFSDDTFTADRGRVLEICRRILDRDLPISWFAIARVDHVDGEMLRWMRRAGCIQVSYGVESGSEAVRKRLNKPIRKDRILRAFDLTTRAGILPRAYFIYGCPGETDETVEESLDLMRRIRPLGAIFYILDVFPGTGLYEGLKREGRISESAWLERIEGVPYFQLDPRITAEDVLSWGKTLRDGFHRLLRGFAEDVTLSEEEDMRPFHADFCSRLAMTFSHGDYARIPEVPNADRVAETLYRRSLGFFPDHRAYLGLAVLLQKRGDHAEALRLLQEALERFPESEPLGLCLGVTLMSVGRYDEALAWFSRFPESWDAAAYAARCRELRKATTG